MSYRIIACGSRGFKDRSVIAAWLRCMAVRQGRVGPITIVHGACSRGADFLVSRAAMAAGFEVEAHPADWPALGRGAGPARNKAMLALGADEVVAFWDGKSPGTLGMMKLARAAGVQVMWVREGDALEAVPQ